VQSGLGSGSIFPIHKNTLRDLKIIPLLMLSDAHL